MNKEESMEHFSRGIVDTGMRTYEGDIEMYQNWVSIDNSNKEKVWIDRGDVNRIIQDEDDEDEEGDEKQERIEEVTIYGRSDDLIEVRGAVTREIYADSEDPTTIRVGGWVIDVYYNGKWRLEVNTLDSIAAAWKKHYPSGHEESPCEYSQTLVLPVVEGAGVEKVEY